MEAPPPAVRIGELSQRTGVGIATLRAWERRYRLLRPSRTAGGQRLYSADDEARVRTVQHLVAAGSTVGAAADWVASGGGLDLDELQARPGASGSRGLARPAADEPRPADAPARGRAGLAVLEGRAPGPHAGAPASGRDLELVHATLRAMVHAAAPADVVAALAAYVRDVGGSLVDAQIDAAVLPIDLSFGLGEPRLPRAEPWSVARAELERELPALAEDGRRLIDLLRRSPGGG